MPPQTLRLPDPAVDPADALAAVVALRRTADQLEAEGVRHALAQGWTWLRIAQALDVSKQAVHKKYARRLGGRES